jgi:hypothetical protein
VRRLVRAARGSAVRRIRGSVSPAAARAAAAARRGYARARGVRERGAGGRRGRTTNARLLSITSTLPSRRLTLGRLSWSWSPRNCSCDDVDRAPEPRATGAPARAKAWRSALREEASTAVIC